MINTKNTDLVGLRDILRKREPEIQAQVVTRLSPAARHLYETALAFEWSDLAEQMEVFVAAADVLFPNERDRSFRLGRLLAEKAYGGVYKAFLRLPSIQYLLGRGAQLWRTYYDVGQAAIESVRPDGCELVIRGFPGFPEVMREQLRGHIAVLLESAGKPRHSITQRTSDPGCWRWTLTW